MTYFTFQNRKMIKIYLSFPFDEFCLKPSILFYYDIQSIAVNFSPLNLFCHTASNYISNYHISQVKICIIIFLEDEAIL